jgi:hypothetical protein
MIFDKIFGRDNTAFKTCHELSLERFIKCLVFEDLSQLVRPGKHSPGAAKLAAIWDSIFFEYIDLVDDLATRVNLALHRETAKMEADKSLILVILWNLKITPNPDLIEFLRKSGYRYEFDATSREKYLNDITLTEKRLKALDAKIARNKSEIQKAENSKESNKMKISDFDALLTELGAFQGYRLDAASISVSEFVAISNRFKSHMANKKKSPK